MSTQRARSNQKEGEFKDPHTFVNMHGEHKVFNQQDAKVILLENDQVPQPQVAEPKIGTRSKSNSSNRK